MREWMKILPLVIVLVVASAISVNDVLEMSSEDADERNFSERDYETINEINRTDEGVKYIVNPEELEEGCPSKDCIPSIDDPNYVNAEDSDWLAPNDTVIGLEIDGEAKAYPLKILNLHEIVNTEVGGEPVMVTYCPLCRSGLAYSRKVDGEILEFGVSGKLWNANLVMYDNKSETYWSQIKGEAIIGPKVPEQLDLRFSAITSWKEWKEGHPDTEVLSRETGIYSESTYSSDPYANYREDRRVGFGVQEVDDRLSSKEIVYGIKIGESTKAYPERIIRRKNSILDNLGNQTILIYENASDSSIRAYTSDRETKSNLERNFSRSNLEDSLVEKEKFREIRPRGFYWFAWSKFNPETEVYRE